MVRKKKEQVNKTRDIGTYTVRKRRPRRFGHAQRVKKTTQ